ncbi:MAG: TrkA family potassium uptake protein [Thermodesulfobacteriota bacterium]|nr:TrkA family potassium uptake protein [Thermodesulfobacteriota bacterium]
MKKKMQIGVIGLGKFSLKFGQSLISLGHEVLGIDNDQEKTKHAQHVFTQVYYADGTDKNALEQIRIHDLEHVLISVGKSISASAMIALHLKELGVSTVWAKALNRDHEKLLAKIGVDNVIIPEHMAAKQIATRISMPGFIEHLPFDKSMAVKEFTVTKWAGKSLRHIDITNRYNVQIVAFKKYGQTQYRYIPKADDLLQRGDKYVAIGTIDQLGKINS